MSNSSTLSADGASAAVLCEGRTVYQIEAVGTFGGGTITPQKLARDQATWLTLGESTLTASGAINVEGPRNSQIRVSLAGATAPSIVTHIVPIS
jgi:hypothetical protein